MFSSKDAKSVLILLFSLINVSRDVYFECAWILNHEAAFTWNMQLNLYSYNFHHSELLRACDSLKVAHGPHSSLPDTQEHGKGERGLSGS